MFSFSQSQEKDDSEGKAATVDKEASIIQDNPEISAMLKENASAVAAGGGTINHDVNGANNIKCEAVDIKEEMKDVLPKGKDSNGGPTANTKASPSTLTNGSNTDAQIKTEELPLKIKQENTESAENIGRSPASSDLPRTPSTAVGPQTTQTPTNASQSQCATSGVSQTQMVGGNSKALPTQANCTNPTQGPLHPQGIPGCGPGQGPPLGQTPPQSAQGMPPFPSMMSPNHQQPPQQPPQSGGPIDAHFMQQHSQIFVFNTSLANQAADSYRQGQHKSILAFHMDQPGTKQFLQKFPPKGGPFNRNPGGVPMFSMNIRQPNMCRIKNSNMANMGPNPNSAVAQWVQQQNANLQEQEYMNFPNNPNNPNMMPQGQGGGMIPWQVSPGHSSQGQMGNNFPALPDNPGFDPEPYRMCGKGYRNLLQNKVPDDKLTPEQLQKREESLASLQKLQLLLFPEELKQQRGFPPGANMMPPEGMQQPPNMFPHSMSPHEMSPQSAMMQQQQQQQQQQQGMMAQQPMPPQHMMSHHQFMMQQQQQQQGMPPQFSPQPGNMENISTAQREWVRLQQEFYAEKRRIQMAHQLNSGMEIPPNSMHASPPSYYSSISQKRQGVAGMNASTSPNMNGPMLSPSIPGHGHPESPDPMHLFSGPRRPPSLSSLEQAGLGRMGHGFSPSGLPPSGNMEPPGVHGPHPGPPMSPGGMNSQFNMPPSAKQNSNLTLQRAGNPEQFQPDMSVGPNSNNKPPPSYAQSTKRKREDMEEIYKNLQPTPSPQQLNYLNAFEGQELTITKQLNTAYREPGPPGNQPPNTSSQQQQQGSAGGQQQQQQQQQQNVPSHPGTPSQHQQPGTPGSQSQQPQGMTQQQQQAMPSQQQSQQQGLPPPQQPGMPPHGMSPQHQPGIPPHGMSPGMPPHGMSPQHQPGMPPHGMSPGMPPHGMSPQHQPGMPPHGMSPQHQPGMPPHGMSPQHQPGMPPHGMSPQHQPGMPPHGMSPQHQPGMPPHGMSPQHQPGMPPHGMSPQHQPGMPPHGMSPQHQPGMPPHGMSPGMPPHGMSPQHQPGMPPHGMSPQHQGMHPQPGMPPHSITQGMPPHSMNQQGMPPQQQSMHPHGMPPQQQQAGMPPQKQGIPPQSMPPSQQPPPQQQQGMPSSQPQQPALPNENQSNNFPHSQVNSPMHIGPGSNKGPMSNSSQSSSVGPMSSPGPLSGPSPMSSGLRLSHYDPPSMSCNSNISSGGTSTSSSVCSSTSSSKTSNMTNITSASLANLAKGVEHLSHQMQQNMMQGGPFHSIQIQGNVSSQQNSTNNPQQGLTTQSNSNNSNMAVSQSQCHSPMPPGQSVRSGQGPMTPDSMTQGPMPGPNNSFMNANMPPMQQLNIDGPSYSPSMQVPPEAAQMGMGQVPGPRPPGPLPPQQGCPGPVPTSVSQNQSMLPNVGPHPNPGKQTNAKPGNPTNPMVNPNSRMTHSPGFSSNSVGNANIQIQAKTPNTIQYLPAQPVQNSQNMNAKHQRPDLDFMQKLTSPGHTLDCKPPQAKMPRFAGPLPEMRPGIPNHSGGMPPSMMMQNPNPNMPGNMPGPGMGSPVHMSPMNNPMGGLPSNMGPCDMIGPGPMPSMGPMNGMNPGGGNMCGSLPPHGMDGNLPPHGMHPQFNPQMMGGGPPGMMNNGMMQSQQMMQGPGPGPGMHPGMPMQGMPHPSMQRGPRVPGPPPNGPPQGSGSNPVSPAGFNQQFQQFQQQLYSQNRPRQISPMGNMMPSPGQQYMGMMPNMPGPT